MVADFLILRFSILKTCFDISYILSVISVQRPEKIVLSNSGKLSVNDISTLENKCERLVVMDKGINISHGLPEHLTSDRVASIIASRYLFSGKECTIFDFGATLTIDKINAAGNYLGGNISLGLRTRFKALNRYSRNLPLVDYKDDVPDLGNSVESSLQAGVVSGILFEINGYLSGDDGNIIVFTGGDANFFAKRMKNCIFVVCNLVLMGLAIVAFEYGKKD